MRFQRYIAIMMLLLMNIWLIACQPKVKPGADLSGADLSGRDLREAKFSEPDGGGFRTVNLSEANLSEANLENVNLVRVNFSNANLSRANLRDTWLQSADLSGADLTRADLSGANLNGANLNGAILVEANLTETKFVTQEMLKSAARTDNLIFIHPPTPSPTPPEPNKQNFTKICADEIAIPSAPTYVKGSGIHHVEAIPLGFGLFGLANTDLIPDKWQARPHNIELITCVQLANTELNRTCQYGMGENTETVALYDAHFKIELYAVSTGELLDSTETTTYFGECPRIWMFHIYGNKGLTYPTQELEKFLKPFVQP